MKRLTEKCTRAILIIFAGLLMDTSLPDRSVMTQSSADADVAACTHPEQVIATMAHGYVAFVNATPIQPLATDWSAEQMQAVGRFYTDAILNGYAGPQGFGSLEAWAQVFGITQAPLACPGPDCCNAGGALRIMYVRDSGNRAGWYDYPDLAGVPAVQTGCPTATVGCPGKDVAYHELAHLWDFHSNGALSTELDRAMGVERKADRKVDVDSYYGRKAGESYLLTGKPPILRHGDFPSAYFDSTDANQPAGGEHFAETVAAFFLIAEGKKYYYPTCWTDEDPRCPPGATYEYDRGDFIADKLRLARIAAVDPSGRQ